ncbi:MAG: cell division transport system permease protein [Candidatus Tokpelaia sp. JSC188]|nr:MAG: cell division transport system permease protein [Candidatus Tokpelaia sp. JSC188]
MTDWHLHKKKWLYSCRRNTDFVPIVPEGERDLALAVVIAIMTFLASLTLGEVNFVHDSSHSWKSQISREATIQIRPTEGMNMEKTLNEAMLIIKSFSGVRDARIVSRSEMEHLLEPWLGSGFDIDALPVPRLIIVTLQKGVLPDFDGIRGALTQNIPSARFDNHKTWIDRFVSMAQGIIAVNIVIFLLVLIAMILSIIFATRGALSSNGHIIEVLYFIGADAGFIAHQFDFCFLRTGMKGAIFGGFCAIIMFFLTSTWLSYNMTTLEGNQMAALFGSFSMSWISYAEILVLIIFVSILTMLTSHYTVVRKLHEIDKKETDYF